MTPSCDKLRQRHGEYRVWLIEKLIINFAMPMDFVYHTVRAKVQKDMSQTTLERLSGLWNGKIAKYQKLLRVKDELGAIPADWEALCVLTPCGKMRLRLAKWANAERRRPKGMAAPRREESAGAPMPAARTEAVG